MAKKIVSGIPLRSTPDTIFIVGSYTFSQSLSIISFRTSSLSGSTKKAHHPQFSNQLTISIRYRYEKVMGHYDGAGTCVYGDYSGKGYGCAPAGVTRA
jgi:hypothetical protein